MKKVVILGGGMASLSAAWALTELPDAANRFDITVHEAGGRLGGKCGSHRGVHGRVEEHGLHVLLGGYHNLFSVMRAVYGALDRPPSCPIRNFDDALIPNDLLVCHEEIGGELVPWTIRFPRLPGQPGADALVPGPAAILKSLTAWIAEFSRVPETVAADGVHARDHARRIKIVLELAIACARGIVVDGVLWNGFDAIDDVDLKVWMRRHGASQEAVDSAIVRTFYDLCFAEPDLARNAAGFSAATSLRCILRWLTTYRGAVCYWMRAGTGETMVAPLYDALLARGVKFAFFSRVTDIQLQADAAQTIRIQQRDDAAFEPLEVIGGLPVWRAQTGHFDDPLAPGPAEDKVLERGVDFDEVVLGITLPALPSACPSLLEAMPRWRSMVESMRATATFGLQVWSDQQRGSAPPMANTGVAPLGGYSDMSHLLDVEQWPAGDRPQHVFHVCNRVDDDVAPTAPAMCRDWLAGRGGMMVPGARSGRLGETTKWQTLHAPADLEGIDRVDAQFITINTHPADKYVLSLPGRLRYRLRADESGISNLTPCGTWTRTGINIGAVEGAVMSGLQAARQVSGDPIRVVGERDWV